MAYLKLLRPLHWLKNLLVLLPVFFAGKIFNSGILAREFYVFVALCLLASSVYVFNDILDRESDRKHTSKKQRPIASGRISVMEAFLIILILLTVAGWIVFTKIPEIVFFLFLYLAFNLSYTLYWKRFAIVDILLISVMYIVRIMAGGAAADIEISSWLIMCIVFGVMFVLLGKRKAEFDQKHQRKSLEYYGEASVNHLFSIAGALMLGTYTLYVILGTPTQLYLYSIFFVILATFRYLVIALNSAQGEQPENIFLKDKMVMISILAWGVYISALVYSGNL